MIKTPLNDSMTFTSRLFNTNLLHVIRGDIGKSDNYLRREYYLRMWGKDVGLLVVGTP